MYVYAKIISSDLKKIKKEINQVIIKNDTN